MVPSLRNRKEDLPLLCNHFLLENRGPDAWSRFTPALRDKLMSYSWPGNVRELRNVLERLECIGPDGVLTPQSGGEEVAGQGLALSFELDRPFKEAKEELIDAFEQEYLKNLLERSNGRIAPAAREAGLNRKYFYDLLRKHGLLGR
jgi:DNA-binding NtrC family response regulator